MAANRKRRVGKIQPGVQVRALYKGRALSGAQQLVRPKHEVHVSPTGAYNQLHHAVAHGPLPRDTRESHSTKWRASPAARRSVALTTICTVCVACPAAVLCRTKDRAETEEVSRQLLVAAIGFHVGRGETIWTRSARSGIGDGKRLLCATHGFALRTALAGASKDGALQGWRAKKSEAGTRISTLDAALEPASDLAALPAIHSNKLPFCSGLTAYQLKSRNCAT